MTRSTSTTFWICRAVMVTLCAGVVAPGFAAESAAVPDRPNVLFLCVNDVNGWVGALGGHPQARTPHLDRLAGRGLLFTNAHCAAPECNPSRTALMTGILPSRSGVYNNGQPFRMAMPDAVTLPQHFRRHGYRTIGVGKLFHGSARDEEGIADPLSWDEFQGTYPEPRADAGVLNDPRNSAGGLAWGRLAAEDREMSDSRLVSDVIGHLNRNHDQPFFLACGLDRCHLPWRVPSEYFDLFPLESIVLPKVLDTDLDDIPPAGRKIADSAGDHAAILATNNWARAVQGYLAALAFVDAQVGRLIDALDASPYADNTIIVVWSDHGWHHGQKQHWRKFTLWEESTRVPLIFVVPGLTKPGSRCDRSVSLVDLYPTLTDLCQLPPRSGLDGVSLRPLLADPSTEWHRPAVTTHQRGNHAVRSDRWRYIRYSDGSEELYDHGSDPLEWTNLADDPRHAPVKAALARWLPASDAPDAPVRRGRTRNAPQP